MVGRLPIITQSLSSVKAGTRGQECLIPNPKHLAHQAPIPPSHFPTAQKGFHVNGSAFVSVLDCYPRDKSLRRNKSGRQGLLDAWVAGSLFLWWDKDLVEWNSSPHNGQETERQWKLKTSHHLQERTPNKLLLQIEPHFWELLDSNALKLSTCPWMNSLFMEGSSWYSHLSETGCTSCGPNLKYMSLWGMLHTQKKAVLIVLRT